MDSYSRKEFETMQQAAIKRVKEMQKRAQSYVNAPQQNNENSKTINENNKTRNQTKGNNYNRNFSNNNARTNRNNFNNQRGNQSSFNRSNNNHPKNNQNQSQMHRGMNPNHQQMPMGNPFSQLFGSNLGAFSKFKNMFKPASSPLTNADGDNGDESKKPLSGLLNGVLKDFDIDEEKIILGVLIYLLYKNGSDTKLLLALGYLIL